jgi:hypothetical protein
MSAGPADKPMDLFKTLVFDELVKSTIAYIIGLAPWLSFGPIAFIIGRVVVYVSGVLYEGMKEAINFEVILLNNAAHHKAFLKAQIELRGIAKNQGIDSPEFKRSREEHKTALAKFVRYSGT